VFGRHIVGLMNDQPNEVPQVVAWSMCPGCGLELPDEGNSGDGRLNASAACWRLYGEVTGYELSHLVELGSLHQLTVDAYGAQHPGPNVPSIGVAFGLIGLSLALNWGRTGLEFREAHQYLGARFRAWPFFERPVVRSSATVLDVALAGSPEGAQGGRPALGRSRLGQLAPGP
jgi:hypothetical protein